MSLKSGVSRSVISRRTIVSSNGSVKSSRTYISRLEK
jgi:hypothetical protein